MLLCQVSGAPPILLLRVAPRKVQYGTHGLAAQALLPTCVGSGLRPAQWLAAASPRIRSPSLFQLIWLGAVYVPAELGGVER